VTDKRLMAPREIDKYKIIVAKASNKKMKAKSIQIGDLALKTILPLRKKD
jgi:hypothetical protein